MNELSFDISNPNETRIQVQKKPKSNPNETRIQVRKKPKSNPTVKTFKILFLKDRRLSQAVFSFYIFPDKNSSTSFSHSRLQSSSGIFVLALEYQYPALEISPSRRCRFQMPRSPKTLTCWVWTVKRLGLFRKERREQKPPSSKLTLSNKV